jgi:hypothetical protein
MSVVKITKNDVESFTLVTTPRRSYSSGSGGITGSIKVFPRQSSLEKDTDASLLFDDARAGAVVDVNFDSAAAKIVNSARSRRAANLPISGDLDSYMALVSGSVKKATAVLDVERFTPTTKLTKYTVCKNNIKDMLMPYYRTNYPHAHWAYTNYHSLNFFTAYDGAAAQVPTGSVLLYPNVPDDDLPGQAGHVSGTYCLTGAFTFDFHINPRYKVDGIDSGHFKDGTIFHLSSSYALSLVTGSAKDPNGLPIGFRLKLQLSHSADYAPSLSSPGSYPYDLVFLSDDNSLGHNNWHHVLVRWGTKDINDGTGSFVVDGKQKGSFVIPSGTIMPKAFTDSLNPDVLSIGNFYEGSNKGNSAQSLFFGVRPARRDGLSQLTNDTAQDEPSSYKFRHPLKAEIHDLTFRRYYQSDLESESTGSTGIGIDALSKKNIAFYLPPFFVEDTPIRRYVGDHGGILQTPFFEIDGTTDDPFNVAMSFGVNGHYINLENFVKEFSAGQFPRLLQLTASTIDYTTNAQDANVFLYGDGSVAKRNLTILPCDDGNFDPNYEILKNETLSNKYTDPYGVQDLSYINLDNLVNTSSLMMGGVNTDVPDDYVTQLYGPSPETPGLEPGLAYKSYIAVVTASISSIAEDYEFDRGIQKGAPLTIYQRLLDPSSNQVTIFNISNLYYGRRIMPGSFEIKDVGISGSHDSIKITLRDDSLGNLYRADANTPHFTQNSVGNIFYDEGIVLVKSPHLYFFGKNQYEMSFRGVQNIFTTKYEVVATPGLLNSSSNATYVENAASLKPSGNPTDNEVFVYISGMNLHDENMNVVAKARLAQPVIKREGDKILFRVAFDY